MSKLPPGFVMEWCPVCERKHEHGPKGWIGVHACPVAGDVCSTCQTRCVRRIQGVVR